MQIHMYVGVAGTEKKAYLRIERRNGIFPVECISQLFFGNFYYFSRQMEGMRKSLRVTDVEKVNLIIMTGNRKDRLESCGKENV